MSKFLFSFAATISIAISANAGAINSGGGKAIVCRDANKQIQTVEVLDLWEGRELDGLKIPTSEKSLQQHIDAATEKLKNLFWSTEHIGTIDDSGADTSYVGPEAVAYQIRQTAKMFLTNNSSVRRLHGKTLTSLDDALEDAFPDGCGAEQVIIYHDAGAGGSQVLINQDLVDHMDEQNQAALYVHEALYRLMRKRDGEANSLRTRRAVALAFSGYQTNPVSDFIPEQFLICANTTPDEDQSIVVIYSNPHSANGSGFIIKPIVLQGIYLTDFNSDQRGMTLKASDLNDLKKKVVVPTSNQSIKSISWTSFDVSQKIDREVTSRLEISNDLGNGNFAMAVSHTTSPWIAEPMKVRNYLRCATGDKAKMFPVGSVTKN